MRPGEDAKASQIPLIVSRDGIWKGAADSSIQPSKFSQEERKKAALNEDKKGSMNETFTRGFHKEDNNYLMIVHEDHPQAAIIQNQAVAKKVFGCGKRAKVQKLPSNNGLNGQKAKSTKNAHGGPLGNNT